MRVNLLSDYRNREREIIVFNRTFESSFNIVSVACCEMFGKRLQIRIGTVSQKERKVYKRLVKNFVKRRMEGRLLLH